MAAGLSVFACCVGGAAAHDPPTGTGVYARGTQLVVRSSRGLVVSRSAERRDFRLLCNEALGVAEFDAPSLLVRADASLLVGTSTGLWRVSSDLCAIEPVAALGPVRVSALVADPHESTHVYAATETGLLESLDEGESFTQLDAHAFDSLEVSDSAQGLIFATGKRPGPAGQQGTYFARLQRGAALDLQDFMLDPNEYGIALLGSDPRRVFGVAHAYLGTTYLDRLLVSTDGTRSWQSPLSAPGIAALLIDAASGVGLIGSAAGLWRATDLDAPPTPIRTDAVSCLARVSSRLYMCDGAGAQGGVSESTDGGEHWRSLLRWNQLAGLAACPSDAPSVQSCIAAWDDWQREIPAGPQLTATRDVDAGANADAGQRDAAVETAQNRLPTAAGCAATSGVSPRTQMIDWLWLTLSLFSIRLLQRLRTKRAHMTRTLQHIVFSASLLLLLLPACDRRSGRSHLDASNADAGAHDSSTPAAPNLLEDAAVSIDAGSGSAGADSAGAEAEGGRGGSGSGGSGQRAGAGGDPGAGRAGAMGSAGAGHAEPPIMNAGSDAGPSSPQGLCTSCGGCEETQKVVSTMHTAGPVTYMDPPPTSGPHNPCWARWGIHDEPEQAMRWVHNLEHGGVVFLYNCPDGCDAEVAIFKDIVSKRSRTILTAYADLPARFGVVSWGHRMVSDCMDQQAFLDFYAKNFDHGPESNANPPNPSCPP